VTKEIRMALSKGKGASARKQESAEQPEQETVKAQEQEPAKQPEQETAKAQEQKSAEAPAREMLKVHNPTHGFFVQPSTGLRIAAQDTKELRHDGWLKLQLKAGTLKKA
jgi:FtsZ-interacting cell division protein ZipA